MRRHRRRQRALDLVPLALHAGELGRGGRVLGGLAPGRHQPLLEGGSLRLERLVDGGLLGKHLGHLLGRHGELELVVLGHLRKIALQVVLLLLGLCERRVRRRRRRALRALGGERRLGGRRRLSHLLLHLLRRLRQPRRQGSVRRRLGFGKLLARRVGGELLARDRLGELRPKLHLAVLRDRHLRSERAELGAEGGVCGLGSGPRLREQLR